MSDKQPGNGQFEQPQNARLFNPNEHLMQIKSRAGAADYLPVQWRLVWFRSLCPNGTIETEIVHLDIDRETEEEVYQWNNETRRSEKIVKRAPGFAVVHAVVKDGRGGVATGTKSEKAASFPDYLEKAETGAIGRALAALGYGTQFTGEEFDERHRIVDAPVDRGASSEPATPSESNGARPAAISRTSSRGQGGQIASKTQNARVSVIDPNAPMSEQQWASIRKLCEHLGKAEPEKTDSMNYQFAKELIAQLTQEYRQSRSKAS